MAPTTSRYSRLTLTRVALRFALVVAAFVLVPMVAWAQNGTISGTVNRASDNTALADIRVNAYTSNGFFVTGVTTGSNGTYQLSLAAGTYYIQTSNSAGFINQLYRSGGNLHCGTGCPFYTNGSGIAVTSGSTTSNIDFSLTAGGRISGTVTAADGTTPLTNVSLYFYTSSNSYVAFAFTNSSGQYITNEGLSASSFFIKTSNSAGYIDELYNNLPCEGLSCSLTGGTGVAVTLGNTTTGINFALDRGAQISGRVTSGSTPLPNVSVQVYDRNGVYRTFGFTGQDGTYTTFGGIAAGNYFLRTFAGQGYLDELYNDISCATGCQITGGTPVAVTLGNTTTGINFDLALGGRISGRVTGGGSPLQNVSIGLYTSTNQSVGFANTDAQGNYTVSQGVPTGTYYARTFVPFDSLYLNELYGGIVCFQSCQPNAGTAITITAGQITPDINFALDLGGSITGTLTSSSGPISAAGVIAYDSTGGFITSVTTNSQGVYTIPRLGAGSYFVRTAAGQGFLDKLHSNIDCTLGCNVTTGTPVAVTLGNSTTVDFTLTLGGRVSGRVTGAGTPLQSVNVALYTPANVFVASAFTDSNGDFTTFQGVPTGTYYARTFVSFGSIYLNEIYNNIACPISCLPSQGTAIQVTTGSVTSNINFDLPEGGRVTGTVRSGTTPLANVSVQLRSASGTFNANGFTNSLGEYSIVGIPTDAYHARTINSDGYIDELHNGIACPSSCASSGPSFNVTAGQATSGIDFDLAPGGRIAGRVTDTGSPAVPIQNVFLNVRASNGQFITGSGTNSNGEYLTATGLPPGTYYITTSNSLGYVDELHNDIPCPGGACPIVTGTAIEITAAGTTSNINFALDTGGRISGTVRDGSGQPVQFASISVFNTGGSSVAFAQTSSTGVYTTTSGLPAGTYFVRVSHSNFIAELYDNIPCFSCSSTTGTSVTVTAGTTTPDINFVLDQGGRVSGTVTDAATGQALPSVNLTISNLAGNSVGAFTNSLGAFSTSSSLPAGTYYARTNNSLGYVDEIFNDVACAGSACSSQVTRGATISVTAGSAVSNINFALTTGGSIAGTVTGDSGAPLGNVTVQVFDTANRFVRGTVTNAAGQYSVSGLPAGNYFAITFNSLGFINERHDNVPCLGCRASDGTPIAVAVGASTTVNFVLTPGARITGTVTTAAGVALRDVSVQVFNAADVAVANGFTNGAGQFTTNPGLPTGTFFVRTSTGGSQGYVDQLYVTPNNVDCLLCTASTGSGVAVTAGQTVQNINFSLRRAGRIRGTVTSGGVPLPNVSVLIVNRNGRQVASGFSNYRGEYVTIGGLPTGQYFAQTSNQQNYINERYNNEHCLRCAAELGAAISVVEGETTSNINFDLDLGGRISGRILGPDGVGLPSVSVSIFNGNNELVTSGFTNAQGIYVTTGGLPAGNYFARTFNTLGFADQIYDNSTCAVCLPNTGTRIQVSAGSTTPNINFLLAVGGRISGRVTDAAGAGVPEVRVQIHDASGQVVLSASTDGSGNYLTTALPGGSYFARTFNSVGFIDEIYNDLACIGGCQPQTGARISVTAGQTTENINFSLLAGAGISGRVTSGSTRLGNITVVIVNAGGTGVAAALTNEAGDYTVRGLVPGTYYARTSNSLGYLDEVYDNIVCGGTSCIATRGTAIVVTAGAVTSGRDFDLLLGGRITGQVTDAAGTALENVSVSFFNASGTRFTTALTNSAGQYSTFGSLPAGTYYASTNNTIGLINEVYNDISCGGVCVPSVGQAITVTAGNTTSGISFALANGGRVSGIVRAAGTNAPIANVSVNILAVGGTFVASAITNAAGEYITPRGLGAGRYLAVTANQAGFLNERSAEFAVTPPTTTENINFTLTAGGRITGRVTNAAGGAGLPGVSVQFFDRSNVRIGTAVTGADGRFATPGVVAGSYFARTTNTAGFIDERYDNEVCLGCVPNLGRAIVVTVGSSTENIDFALVAGGSFRGRITDISGGSALGNVTVTAFGATGTALRTATTDDTGLYEITGLPTGSYFAQTRNERGYADEVYNDVACSYREPCSVTAGTAIAVTQGSAQTGIDFGLGTAGRISGRVTDTATPPVAIAEAVVTIYDVNGRQVAQVTTDGAGGYSTAGGLPPGRYFAQAFADSYVREIYSELPCFPRCIVTDGQAITIASGGAASNINFTLQRGGRISGSVTEGGTPLPNVTIHVFSIGRDVFITQATTDGSGRYITREGLLPGSYLVRTLNDIGRVNKIFGGSVPCLGDIRECEGGNPVTVTAGQITGDINFDLARGALVEGFVLDESPTSLPGEAVAPTAVALAEVDVVVFDDKGKKVAEGKTDTTGKYESKSGMPNGRYFIATKNKLDFTDKAKGGVVCALAKCDVTRSDPVEIVDTSLSRVDFGLRKGGRITGRVTGRRDTAVVPLPDVKVEIYGSTGQLLTSVMTDAGGNYIVDSGLPTGDYFVKTANGLGYVDRIYNNRPCDACKVTDAERVAVSAGATVTGINFELVRGALVSGTIFTRDSGVPITDAPVIIKKIVGNTVETVAKAKTDDKGVFTTSLPQGTYYAQTDGLPGYQTKIYRQPTGTGPLRGQIWPTCPLGLCDPSLGTPIDLASGAFVGQIDIGLDSCPALTVSPARLPIGSLGTPYSQTISVSGGAGPYNFRVSDGELPPGLTLNVNTGAVSGSTSAAGSTTFTVAVLDSNGCAGTRSYNPTICSIDISGTSASVSTAAGSGTLSILAAAGDCPWSATSDSAWLTLSSTSGTGNATITYSYAARGPSAQARVGTITIGGHSFRLTQAGIVPSFSVSPTTINVHPRAGTNSVEVTANATDATWTVTSNEPWITPVTTTGTGSGSATFSVARNSTQAARSGTLSVAGENVTVVQLPNGVPGEPVNLSARVTGGRARFTWAPPLTGGDATSYVLAAGLAPGQTLITFASPNATPVYDLDLTLPDGQYYFRVSGQNEFGSGAASEDYHLVVNGGTNPPTAPLNLAASITGDQLIVTWSAPAAGGAPTGYLLEVGSGAGLANLATVPVSEPVFRYTGVPPGNYFLRVRAVNAAGPSAPSNEVLLNAGGVPPPPGAPRSASATATAGGNVTIAWLAPADGGAPTSYVLEAGTARGLANLATVNVGSGTSVSFPGVPPGVYWLRIRGQNAQGTGMASNEIRLVVP